MSRSDNTLLTAGEAKRNLRLQTPLLLQSPAGTILCRDKCRSCGTWGEGVVLFARRLKSTVNKVLSLRDFALNKLYLHFIVDRTVDYVRIGAMVQKNSIEKTTQEESILALIKNKSTISRKNIALQLGIGTTTVYRYIESLKEKGIIERKGGDKGGYWAVKH